MIGTVNMWKDWDSTLRLRSFTIIVMIMKVTKTRGGSRGTRCLWASSTPSSSSTALISGALTNLKQKFEIEMWHVTLHFHIRCHSHMTVHCNNYHMYMNTLVNVFQGFWSSSAKKLDDWSKIKKIWQIFKSCFGIKLTLMSKWRFWLFIYQWHSHKPMRVGS